MGLLTEYPIYVVLLCALLIWVGVAFFLVSVNGKVKALEDRLKK